MPQAWQQNFDLKQVVNLTVVKIVYFVQFVLWVVFKIGFVSDAGVFAHGNYGKEFQLMVDAGMPAMEAIQSATSVAAARLGEPNIGYIGEGKWADLVGVMGDPSDNISILSVTLWAVFIFCLYTALSPPCISKKSTTAIREVIMGQFPKS